MLNFIILLLVLGMMLIGLVGEILPGIPGIILIWVAALVYGIFDNFQHISWLTIILLVILWLFAASCDYFIHYLTAKHFQISWWGLLLSIATGLVGLFYFQILGLIIGSIVGGCIGEWIAKRAWLKAIKAGIVAFLAIILSGVIKITLALLMIFIFIGSLIF